VIAQYPETGIRSSRTEGGCCSNDKPRRATAGDHAKADARASIGLPSRDT
jgi:hypothetical protein